MYVRFPLFFNICLLCICAFAYLGLSISKSLLSPLYTCCHFYQLSLAFITQKHCVSSLPLSLLQNLGSQVYQHHHLLLALSVKAFFSVIACCGSHTPIKGCNFITSSISTFVGAIAYHKCRSTSNRIITFHTFITSTLQFPPSTYQSKSDSNSGSDYLVIKPAYTYKQRRHIYFIYYVDRHCCG